MLERFGIELEQSGCHADRNFTAILSNDRDPGIFDCVMTAESIFKSTLLVTDFSSEHIEALFPDCFGGAEAGDFFGSPVERGNPAFFIDREYPVADTVEYELADLHANITDTRVLIYR